MDDDLLQATLESMGFSGKAVREAIIKTGGKNIDTCVEYIISNNLTWEDTPKQSSSNKSSTASKVTEKPIPSPSNKKTKYDLEDDDYMDEDDDFDFIEEEELDPETRETLIDAGLADDDPLLSTSTTNVVQDVLMPIAKKMEIKGIKILSQNEVQKLVDDEIQKICNMFEVPFSVAVALLQYYKWDSEKLIERYFDNPEKELRQSGIDKQALPKFVKESKKECAVCCDDFEVTPNNSLNCGHSFCKNCWMGYLTVKIQEGESELGCMAPKCNGKVPAGLIREVVPNLFGRYQKFLVESFVKDNSLIKWCPAPKCSNAAKCDIKNEWEVNCTCGYKFCFKCSEEAHAPADCKVMKEWFKKCQDDSETGNWLSVNTKDCPRCNTSIEKNGGCNHMTCWKCRHEFCWICHGDWKAHSNCNAYKEDPKLSTARAALERYLHYFHRYNVHEQSKKLEQNLRAATLTKMLDLQSSKSLRWIDVQYLEAAVEQLIECRRTLKYTYVYAFFLPDGTEKNLFEYLQAQLETETENLSGLLEHSDLEWLLNQKKHVIEVTKVAAKRLDHLLEGVKAGLVDESAKKNSQAPAYKDLFSSTSSSSSSSSSSSLLSVPKKEEAKKDKGRKALWDRSKSKNKF